MNSFRRWERHLEKKKLNLQFPFELRNEKKTHGDRTLAATAISQGDLAFIQLNFPLNIFYAASQGSLVC
jgi:hypothetical protein